MKTAYSYGEVVDNYDTLEEAILSLVELWHENAVPEAFVIRDEEQLVAATICPVGSDKAVVVYAHGQVDTYEGITYHKRDGKITHTSCRYNGSTLEIMIKNGKRLV